MLDLNGGPTHPGPDECEGLVKCGDDSMLIAETTFKNKSSIDTFYPQVNFCLTLQLKLEVLIVHT